MQHSLSYLECLVAGAVRVRCRDDARTIALMIHAASMRGENSTVWHQSAIFYDHPCNCAPCAALRAKFKRA